MCQHEAYTGRTLEMFAFARRLEETRLRSCKPFRGRPPGVRLMYAEACLIFGTPGLLSLQFVVASVAAVASSFVFLSLVLSQRQKELAVLQAIGASPNQIIRLVLFEILSIVVVSMALGIVLGAGLALSFNGFFDIFGFIFQIFGGSSTTIQRTLVYPWSQIILVSLAVFAAVVVALLVTTRRALTADLASVLKGE